MNKDYARLTIGLDKDIKKRLRLAAAFLDISMSELIFDAIVKHLEYLDKKIESK